MNCINSHWNNNLRESFKNLKTAKYYTGASNENFTFYLDDGQAIGPPLGVRGASQARNLLAFSNDEQVLLMGDPEGMPRMWRVPAASVTGRVAQQSGAHMIWSPAADRKLVVSPDGSFVVIGDPAGRVHIISSDATLEAVAEISDDVSFVGHSSEVRLVAVAESSTLAASVAADNTLRVWRTSSGEPLPYVAEIAGAPVSRIVFSPAGLFLGLLSGHRVSVVDVADGSVVAEYDSGTAYSALTFAAENQLYLGTGDGTLQLLGQGDDKNWHLQQVWQGPEGIRALRVSPRGDSLILVDHKNFATQFFLADGRIGEGTLQLPSNVQEIVFDKNSTQVYFRTPRWVHRASSSIGGLTWMNAILVPRPLNGAGIVHGNGASSPGTTRKIYLPVASEDFIELVELSFNYSATAGLFGSKEELLQEWRSRISAAPREEF